VAPALARAESCACAGVQRRCRLCRPIAPLGRVEQLRSGGAGRDRRWRSCRWRRRHPAASGTSWRRQSISPPSDRASEARHSSGAEGVVQSLPISLSLLFTVPIRISISLCTVLAVLPPQRATPSGLPLFTPPANLDLNKTSTPCSPTGPRGIERAVMYL
jgi:hypothetical protein